MDNMAAKKISRNKAGFILVAAIIAVGLFSVILLGALSLASLQMKLNLTKIASTQALHVADAGVNYYRWVLYHQHDDYCNNEACKPGPAYGPYGPYAYSDASGNITGYYELYITPPPTNGSTIVKVRSVGWISGYPKIKREIEVRLGIPAWSTYSTLCNAFIRFGAGTEVWGPIHSNSGLRFDGISHNLITSSVLNFADPDHGGGNEFGVHTHTAPVDPLPDGNNPPQNVPDRPDVFMAGRTFPISVVSFDMLDNYINEIYAMATSSGYVLPASGVQGYHFVITPQAGVGNDEIKIYKVNTVTGTCDGQDTYGITDEALFATIVPPANGIIFAKDRVWIDGQINNERVNILAFSEPFAGSASDILINSNLLYTNYDGTDAIGLIAQRNISIGMYSLDTLEVDAGMIAKTGRIGRNYYTNYNSNGCNSTYSIRTSITVRGSLATKNRYGFAYTDNTGYIFRNLIYDNFLTFAPPPHFPSTGEYTFISWKEK
jgi:hypothetical protein